MKKIKILLTMAVLIATILVLSSCGNADISDTFAKKSTPAQGKEIESITALTGMENFNIVPTVLGDLASFETSQGNSPRTFTVVNVSTGTIVYSKTTSKNVYVMLHKINVEGKDVCLFKVNELGEDASSTVYDANGNKLLSFTDGTVPMNVTADLLHIEGKCYRVQKDGSIKYAFDYPPFSDFPTTLQKYDDYYYDFTSTSVTVYDDELEFVSKYTIPSYAEEYTLSLLENGNILVQYTYYADALSKDYDIVDNYEKFELVTQIFKIRSGKTKNIRCNYIFRYLNNSMTDPDALTENGLKPKKLSVYGEAYKIEDKKINKESVFVKVSNRGKVTEFDKINGETIKNFNLLDTNRYIVTTASHKYLMTHRGKILGEISNATVHGKYLVSESNYQIYDSNLNPLFNYGDDSYSIYGMIGDNIILYSHLAGQDHKIFSGSSDLKTYANSSARGIVKLTGDGFYIHQPDQYTDTFEFRDIDGNTVTTLTQVRAASLIAETDDAALVSVYGSNGSHTFYVVKYK